MFIVDVNLFVVVVAQALSVNVSLDFVTSFENLWYNSIDICLCLCMQNLEQELVTKPGSLPFDEVTYDCK